MNATTFLKERLNLPANNQNKAAVREALECYLGGVSRVLNGVQNAWWIPMAENTPSQQYLNAVDDKSSDTQ